MCCLTACRPTFSMGKHVVVEIGVVLHHLTSSLQVSLGKVGNERGNER